MSTDLPDPPIPAGVDLQGFSFTPLYRARFFGSAFHARSTDGEWRAGVTLDLKAWDQVPAGSLPDDDIELCRLAELGRDMKTWRKVKPMALHGWYRASDGRLYNDVVAELVMSALEKKRGQTDRTAKARQVAIARRLIAQAGTSTSVTRAQPEQQQTLLQTNLCAVTDPVTTSVTESNRREGNRSEEKIPAPQAADAPIVVVQPSTREQLFRAGKQLLAKEGISSDRAGGFLAKLCKEHGDDAVLRVIEEAQTSPPAEPKSWLTAALARAKGTRGKGRRSTEVGQQDYNEDWRPAA